MEWRPEGLKNPYNQAFEKAISNCSKDNPIPQGWANMTATNAGIFSSGADAMLKELKKYGVFTYGNHTPDIDINDAPEVSGYWCFIPEENR